jgi:hypothetical protein
MPPTTRQAEAEPEITKRRVTMTSTVLVGRDDKGRELTMTATATDHVTPDFLDAYLVDARTRWQLVEVSDEPDAGPGGYHGQTAVPEGLDHPAAGQVRAATKKKG